MLVNFCTYTCINWLRTLPYVRAWSQKYKQGLVVLGVHTPEFAFEKNLDNVRRAVQHLKIEYPIVDARGRIRDHQLIRQRAPIVDRQFQIEFLDRGVEALAFTFG